MINITKLYCDRKTPGDWLRYEREGKERKPIVVWNMSRRCNLGCIHCYSDSYNVEYQDELTPEEGRRLIDDLAEFKAPVLLFSGGEPLLHKHLFDFGRYAKKKGIRTVISTNGTLITADVARDIKRTEFDYVGISLDGIGSRNDEFRGMKGAFDLALRGIRSCKNAGVKVGLRLTLTQHNARELADIFKLIEEEDIERACFYHLVYTGRGSSMDKDDLAHSATREAVDLIIKKTNDFQRRGLNKDILTVDNHADGVYLYLLLKREDPKRAEEVYRLLKANGGNLSGIAIANIDNLGNVHADQFWWNYSFGNVRERKFADIWQDTSDPIMKGLKDRRKLLKGRCGACRYQELCNGNLRVRALSVFGDVWAQDPACYLTDEEIGIKK